MSANIQHRHSRAQKAANEGALGKLEPTVHLGPAHVVVPRQKPSTERQRDRQRHSGKESAHSQAYGKIFLARGHRCESLRAGNELIALTLSVGQWACHLVDFKLASRFLAQS